MENCFGNRGVKMDNVYVYGAGTAGREFLERSRKLLSERIVIKGFIDKSKKEEVCGCPIVNIDALNESDRIIIAIRDCKMAINIYRDLCARGFKNIWWLKDEDIVPNKKMEDQLFDVRLWSMGAVYQVEMHIVDTCNLNCRGCAHFSPIFKTDLPMIDQRLSDVKKLNKKIPYISRFYILGGEPFLNPEIGEYAVRIGEILTNSEIWIVTNGIMIPQIDSSIMKRINQSRAKVSISRYEPTDKMIDRIEHRLEEYGIPYEVRPSVKKNGFNIPLSLKKNSSYEKLCISNGCITIWNGFISRCPSLMYINTFNTYFEQSLPSDGIISLDSSISGWSLIDKLNERVPLCDYCVKNPTDWSQCKRNPVIEDFAVFD